MFPLYYFIYLAGIKPFPTLVPVISIVYYYLAACIKSVSVYKSIFVFFFGFVTIALCLVSTYYFQVPHSENQCTQVALLSFVNPVDLV